MYQSHQLLRCKNPQERQNLLERIKRSSIVTWKHINLQGEYDFSDSRLKDAMEFDIQSLLNLKLD